MQGVCRIIECLSAAARVVVRCGAWSSHEVVVGEVLEVVVADIEVVVLFESAPEVGLGGFRLFLASTARGGAALDTCKTGLPFFSLLVLHERVEGGDGLPDVLDGHGLGDVPDEVDGEAAGVVERGLGCGGSDGGGKGLSELLEVLLGLEVCEQRVRLERRVLGEGGRLGEGEQLVALALRARARVLLGDAQAAEEVGGVVEVGLQLGLSQQLLARLLVQGVDLQEHLARALLGVLLALGGRGGLRPGRARGRARASAGASAHGLVVVPGLQHRLVVGVVGVLGELVVPRGQNRLVLRARRHFKVFVVPRHAGVASGACSCSRAELGGHGSRCSPDVKFLYRCFQEDEGRCAPRRYPVRHAPSNSQN